LKNGGKALDEEKLQQLALHYVGRFATTKRKLADYLNRKLRERGWAEEEPPDIGKLVLTFEKNGYVDDALYAESKAQSLLRRGYGPRRIHQALYQAGIEETHSDNVLRQSETQRFAAAKIYAQKKSIGPFAAVQADQNRQKKQLNAFLRAGHDYDIASYFVYKEPGSPIDDPE